MKNWFTSLNGAVVLTALALLSEAWRGFLDAIFVIPVDMPGPTTGNIAAIVFAVLFGGWTLALVHTWRGSRRALIVTFVLNLLVLIVIPISWLLFYCPAACRAEAGIFNLANTMNFVFGSLAVIALGIQIWRPEQQRLPHSEAEGAFDATQ